MTRRRALLLLEVLVGLALLAVLGVWLLKLETAAIRQYRYAAQQQRAAVLVEELLNDWSIAGVPVTLPASGHLDDELNWRRSVRPVRLARDLLPTQVTVVVTCHGNAARDDEVYRVEWLVMPEQRYPD